MIIVGGNPAYTAPADLQFGAALAKVATSIHLGAEDDETAAAAKWHLPEAHYLEAWGDAQSTDGVAAVQQPMIEPIFGGKSAIEVMAVLLDSKDRKGYDLVKNYWTSQWPAATRDNTWKKTLNDGVIAGTQAAEVKPTVDSKRIQAAPVAAASGIEVGFVPSASTWDGRFANNAWMQEAPDPITKLVWGNVALISPAMGREKGWKDGDMVALTRGNMKLEAAVMVQPGHADNAVTIALGYGRPRAGSVGTNVGFNAGLIRTSDNFWFGQGFAIAATGEKFVLASTQEHGSMEEPQMLASIKANTRPLARETTIEEYKKNAKVIEEMQEVPELDSVYPQLKWEGLAVGHGDRSGRLHRLQRLRSGLPGREQRSFRRQGSGAARPRNALDPDGPLLRRQRGRSARGGAAGSVHAVRKRAVRKRLPGAGHHAQSRRLERHGVQPLRRHAVLLQQLSV